MRLDLCLHAKTEQGLVMVAIQLLESLGWQLTPPGETSPVRHWEPRGAFCARMHISERTLRRRLAVAQARGEPRVKVSRGKILASAAFEDWVRPG